MSSSRNRRPESGAPNGATTRASPHFLKRHSDALFAVGFGLLFAAVGGSLGLFLLPQVRADSDAARALPVATPASVTLMNPGTRVLFEARIAETAPAAFRDFVAFERSEFDGSRGDGGRQREVWKLRETVAPALPLEAGSGARDGAARIVNSGYELQDPPHTWRSTEELVSRAYGESTQRYKGFIRGDTVVVDAVIERARGGELKARLVFGGTRAAYLDALAENALVMRILSLAFLGAGLLVALGGVIAIVRRNSAAP
jgi:hypothetical protein